MQQNAGRARPCASLRAGIEKALLLRAEGLEGLQLVPPLHHHVQKDLAHEVAVEDRSPSSDHLPRLPVHHHEPAGPPRGQPEFVPPAGPGHLRIVTLRW